MVALFATREDAAAYRDACDVALDYPQPGAPVAPYPYGWTITWAVVREVDGAWPVQVCVAVPVPDGVPVVPEPLP